MIPFRDKREVLRRTAVGNTVADRQRVPDHPHGAGTGGPLELAALPGAVLSGADATLLDLLVRNLTVDGGRITMDVDDPRILTGLNQFGYQAASQANAQWLMEDPETTLALVQELLGVDLDGRVTLSDQTANISATSLVPNGAIVGAHLVFVIHTCTSAGSAGTLATTIRWTDANGAQSAKPAADILLTGTATAFGILLLDHPSIANDITYETAITGGAGDPEYRLLIRTVPLG